MQNLGLIPLRNFAVIDHSIGLYRSAQPVTHSDYKWLKEVAGIDVIINLRAESQHDEDLAAQHGMKVIHMMVEDHHTPTIFQARYFMKCIQSLVHNGFKILIHCEHGHGRTSTFCVLARIATGWTLEKALKEENERFHYHFTHPAQIEFLQQYFSNTKNVLSC